MNNSFRAELLKMLFSALWIALVAWSVRTPLLRPVAPEPTVPAYRAGEVRP